MGQRDQAIKEAYAMIRNEDAPTAARLRAHREILRYGATDLGDTARQERIAEALSDACRALSLLMDDMIERRTRLAGGSTDG